MRQRGPICGCLTSSGSRRSTHLVMSRSSSMTNQVAEWSVVPASTVSMSARMVTCYSMRMAATRSTSRISVPPVLLKRYDCSMRTRLACSRSSMVFAPYETQDGWNSLPNNDIGKPRATLDPSLFQRWVFTYRHGQYHKRKKRSSALFSFVVLPAGIEPTLHPPQGCVLSIERRELFGFRTPRTHRSGGEVYPKYTTCRYIPSRAARCSTK